MGSFKCTILQGARIVWQGERTKPFTDFNPAVMLSFFFLRTRWELRPTSLALLGWLWSVWDANIHCRRAASKEGLTEGQAIDCLATGSRDFAWGSVIFTEKTSISSNCESCGHIYREPGTRYDTRYIQRHERSGWFSVTCWGWMSCTGIGILECIHSRFNASQYVYILENLMLPSFQVWDPKGNWIY